MVHDTVKYSSLCWYGGGGDLTVVPYSGGVILLIDPYAGGGSISISSDSIILSFVFSEKLKCTSIFWII